MTEQTPEEKAAQEKEEQEAILEQDKKTQETIDKANSAAERLEKANQEMNENILRQETAKAEAALGGTTEAGEGKAKETDADYAKKVMANDIETDK